MAAHVTDEELSHAEKRQDRPVVQHPVPNCSCNKCNRVEKRGEEGEGGEWGLRVVKAEQKQKDTEHCLQQSAKTEIIIFLSPVFKLLRRQTLSQHPKKPPVKSLYSNIEMTMKKKQMILYIFFFECVRVYNIYIYIYLYFFMYITLLAHTCTRPRRDTQAHKNKHSKKDSHATHFFFLLRGKQKESKKIKRKYDSEQKKGEIN